MRFWTLVWDGVRATCGEGERRCPWPCGTGTKVGAKGLNEEGGFCDDISDGICVPAGGNTLGNMYLKSDAFMIEGLSCWARGFSNILSAEFPVDRKRDGMFVSRIDKGCMEFRR